MCGIVGYVGNNKNSLNVLIDGLERLEYRGYDSAGVAFVSNNKLNIEKCEGRILNLKNRIDFSIYSNVGIGHTRWATHGEANSINSHPHRCGNITLVHNGIIENFDEIKKELLAHGVNFVSETDTEVASALINELYNETNDMNKAIVLFQKKVRGSYAMGIINDNELDTIYTVRCNSPLIVGIGDDENFIASDVPAILKYTNKYVTLDNGDFARINSSGVTYFNKCGDVIAKDIKVFDNAREAIDKNGYEHFMLKEIHEQPTVFMNTIKPYLNNGIDSLLSIMPDFSNYDNIHIVACGSAMHAGMVGKSLIEEFGDTSVTVSIASEFRYKKLFINNKSLVIVISQSGETADTLAALNRAREHGAHTLGIINVKGSSIAREADTVLYTEAGIEVAVATTKAYSAQVTLLSLIALSLASKKSCISKEEIKSILEDIKALPDMMVSLLDRNEYKDIAKKIYKENDIFFIGRDIDYALCMEGSLKLKEISYIHSEAYAAGELKHGTISLIDKNTFVISLVTEGSIGEKTISNIKEVKSRGANVIYITTDKLDVDSNFYDDKIVIPTVHKLIQPLLTVIPLQMISYEVAKLRECDIDKPKNLAKSVTVE